MAASYTPVLEGVPRPTFPQSDASDSFDRRTPTTLSIVLTSHRDTWDLPPAVHSDKERRRLHLPRLIIRVMRCGRPCRLLPDCARTEGGPLHACVYPDQSLYPRRSAWELHGSASWPPPRPTLSPRLSPPREHTLHQSMPQPPTTPHTPPRYGAMPHFIDRLTLLDRRTTLAVRRCPFNIRTTQDPSIFHLLFTPSSLVKMYVRSN
ncbi:hypothetical protein CBL_13322 [Carabus blaptoides fortunei]